MLPQQQRPGEAAAEGIQPRRVGEPRDFRCGGYQQRQRQRHTDPARGGDCAARKQTMALQATELPYLCRNGGRPSGASRQSSPNTVMPTAIPRDTARDLRFPLPPRRTIPAPDRAPAM